MEAGLQEIAKALEGLAEPLEEAGRGGAVEGLVVDGETQGHGRRELDAAVGAG